MLVREASPGPRGAVLESLFVTEGNGQLGPILRVGIGPKMPVRNRSETSGSVGVGRIGRVGRCRGVTSVGTAVSVESAVSVGSERRCCWAERNGVAGFSQSDMLRGQSGHGRDRVGAQCRHR